MENIRKKRGGRTGGDCLVILRLPAECIERFDQLARDNKVSFSQMLRVLLQEGWEALRRKQRRLKTEH
jgi:Ribbon-helix-helix protein, copG family